MQLFCNKWLDIAPQYNSAVSVTTSTCSRLQETLADSLIDGIALNLFSTGDDGCFHIRDAILVFSIV
jgi:hypothetical protein